MLFYYLIFYCYIFIQITAYNGMDMFKQHFVIYTLEFVGFGKVTGYYAVIVAPGAAIVINITIF